MRNSRISNRAAVCVITLSIVATTGVTISALYAAEPKPIVHPKNYCNDPKCHSSPETAKRMQEKEGMFK